MSGGVLRLLTLDDLDAALTLSSTAGWNQQRADWRMLLTLAPQGSFAAIDGGRVVGTSMGIDYGGFGWIAMMLVDPAYRGRGLGGRLLEAAMEAIPSDRPIRLDATPLGRPLYARHGFIDEARLSRHVAKGPGRHLESADESPDVRAMTAADLVAISDQDAAIFGGRRRAVLEWALDRAPEYAYLVQGPAGLPHYCFGRHGRLFDQIGPVVTDDARVERGLLSAALRKTADRSVAIDVFDDRTAITSWLAGIGFHVERPLFRMRRPAKGRVADTDFPDRQPSGLRESAIFGPEFG